jgi:hypothetical protein
MKEFIKQYWLIILLTVIAVVLLVIRLISNEQQQAQLGIISIEPQSGLLEQPPAEVAIVFNRVVESQDQIELVISPQVQVKENIQEDKVVYEFVSELEGKYYFELKANGQSLYSWNYEIPVQTVPTLPPDDGFEAPRGDPQIIYDDAEEIYNNYPLIKYMPYSDDDFAINYDSPLVLRVKIKNPDVEATKIKVLQWIEDKEVDPSTHEIIWL